MNTVQISNESKTSVPMKLEVQVIPVSDVDRAKAFYGRLGWRLDADFVLADDFRVLQMTPPGSAASIMFGKGLTSALPGSVQGTFLVVSDIEAARAELVSRGVDVSEPFHFDLGLRATGTEHRLAGADAQRRTYSSYLSFSDPDGNSWLVQEVRGRAPGRGLELDLPTMTELLVEAEQRHGEYERIAPKHHWSAFYARYVLAREEGRTPEEAARDAAAHVAVSLRDAA